MNKQQIYDLFKSHKDYHGLYIELLKEVDRLGTNGQGDLVDIKYEKAVLNKPHFRK